jgi:hypothetical protein
MGGGSAPAGNTTTTTSNVPFNAGALENIDSQAQNLQETDPSGGELQENGGNPSPYDGTPVASFYRIGFGY